jgi:nicotinic acid mononucleotide adenylyltransferase
MNPTTPGHLFLIQKLIEEAISKNVDHVYIILSKRNYDEETLNILGNTDDITKTMIRKIKEKILEQTADPELKTKIYDIIVITMCVPDVKDATPFTPIIDIVKGMSSIPDINLLLIIGEDDKNILDSITEFFVNLENVNSISGKILERKEMSDYKEKSANQEMLNTIVMSEVPINAISGSFVRNIVKNYRRDKFFELYLPYFDESTITVLYYKMLERI